MRNLKIIRQTIFNNNGGKAVYAEQVFDNKAKKFQEDINKELKEAISNAGNSQEILNKLQEIETKVDTTITTLENIETRLKKIEDNIIIPD